MTGANKEGEVKRGPGRPPKIKGSGASKTPNSFDFASTSTTQGPNSNRYQQLNPDEDLSETDSVTMEISSQTSKRRRISNNQTDQTAPPKAAPKPPPMNISGKTFAQVQQSLAKTNVSKDNYHSKLSQQGVRVFASNDEDYKKIFEKLREENTKFFTHQTREQQTTKFVLHGLYKMAESELQQKLEEAGIKPSKVITLTIRQQKYSDHCVYLLHYPKVQKMKISKLREIKAIDQVIVRWEYYQNKRKGPIQCSNCMQFGHGKQSCFLDPICMRCGNGHATKDCDLLRNPETNEIGNEIPRDKLKCGLCGENHTANYSKCKKREEFMNRQNVYRKRTQRKNHQQPNQYQQSNQQPNQHQQSRQQQNQYEEPNHVFVTSPQLNGFDYPRLPKNNQQVPGFQRQEEAEIPKIHPRTDGSLYTAKELMLIMVEIVQITANAKTQVDQLVAVSDIIEKYSNGFTR